MEGRKVQEEFLRQKKAAVRIQSFVRMVLVRRRFLKIKTSIIHLQAAFKGQKERHYFELKMTALVKIQSWWRNVQLTKSVKDEYEESRRKVFLVQELLR